MATKMTKQELDDCINSWKLDLDHLKQCVDEGSELQIYEAVFRCLEGQDRAALIILQDILSFAMDADAVDNLIALEKDIMPADTVRQHVTDLIDSVADALMYS